ncbi:MAG: hypothetical protein WA395_13335 [Nitrososphaeraceae archaeon]
MERTPLLAFFQEINNREITMYRIRNMKIMKREPEFLLISLLAVLTVTSSSVLLSNCCTS